MSSLFDFPLPGLIPTVAVSLTCLRSLLSQLVLHPSLPQFSLIRWSSSSPPVVLTVHRWSKVLSIWHTADSQAFAVWLWPAFQPSFSAIGSPVVNTSAPLNASVPIRACSYVVSPAFLLPLMPSSSHLPLLSVTSPLDFSLYVSVRGLVLWLIVSMLPMGYSSMSVGKDHFLFNFHLWNSWNNLSLAYNSASSVLILGIILSLLGIYYFWKSQWGQSSTSRCIAPKTWKQGLTQMLVCRFS